MKDIVTLNLLQSYVWEAANVCVVNY